MPERSLKRAEAMARRRQTTDAAHVSLRQPNRETSAMGALAKIAETSSVCEEG